MHTSGPESPHAVSGAASVAVAMANEMARSRGSVPANYGLVGFTVSLDLSLPLKALGRPLQESIRELRRGYQSVSECLEQALADCEQRGSELADCRHQLAETRRGLSERERQIAERTRAEAELSNCCSSLQANLESKTAELSQAHERMVQIQGACSKNEQRLELQAEQSEQLHAQIARLESDYREARDELTQLRGQFTPLAEAASEAARLRGELSAAQVEMARLRDQVANPAEGVELQQQLCTMQAERQHLEGELETLRRRALDLGETLAEQQRVAAAERDEWSEELRRMREVLERQSEVWAERASQPAGDAATELAAAQARLLEAEAGIVRSKERLQVQTEQNEQLRKEIEALEANREAARDELAQLRGQVGPLTESAAQAAQLRAELDAANTELARLSDQIAQAPDGALLQQQVAAAAVERQQLENELDLLRHRGAELVEQLAEQKRVGAAEREGWSEELRQLRKAVEMQSEALAQRDGATAAVAPTATSSAAEPALETAQPHASNKNGTKPEDSVLGSVMEQFQMLQRTKVRKLTKSKR